MSTGMTHLLAKDGSFCSTAGNNIEALCYIDTMLQCYCPHPHEQAVSMKFDSLERGRLGHIFLQTIPECNNSVNMAK